MKTRFTLDGDAALETHLEESCRAVANGVRALVPPERLEAIVLGGGYGRGEGGVLREPGGHFPYNDLEFYVFMHGSRLLNEREFGHSLRQFGEDLAPAVGLHVEFKVDSTGRMRRCPVTMFSYDLVSAHRVVQGSPGLFAGCTRHLEPKNIPPAEATRLLFNRCTGLLLARELLTRPEFDAGESDFVARNLAKAQLAMGDAVLTLAGEYHWSCRKRNEQLHTLTPENLPVELRVIREHHRAGVEFKLHPRKIIRSPAAWRSLLERVSTQCQQLWLWMESRRLRCGFATVRDYALHPVRKCPESPGWRNYFLNLRTFGPGAAFDGMSSRYPRERLLNALPLLLWNDDSASSDCIRQLQRCLRTTATTWSDLVTAYKNVWQAYG